MDRTFDLGIERCAVSPQREPLRHLAIRAKLRAIVGATDAGRTVEQLVAAMDVLEHAKQSWSRYAGAEAS
jgi:hypothetical protein